MSGQRSGNRQRISIGGALAAALALGSACGSDGAAGDAVADAPAPTASAAPSTAEPEPEREPASTSPTESTITSPTTSTTVVPASTVPTESIGLREGLILTAAWPYETSNFDVPFSFSAPTDDVLGRWRTLFDTSNYLILTLQQADKESPDVRREEPGVVFLALPEDMSGDDFIELWSEYAATEESFSVDVSDGQYLGESVRVVTGDYVLAEDRSGALFLRLADGFSVPVAPGERRYVTYLVPVEDRVVAVRLNAHELDFDLIVTLANELVATIDFT